MLSLSYNIKATLMSYTYEYPRPAVTVDCLVFLSTQATTKILLIQRKNPPFKNKWALPGGFIDIDEPLERAAYRELKEETGISDIELQQFRTFGKPGRDPRGRTISIVYYGFIKNQNEQARAGSDARNAQWFDLNMLPDLAFDHDNILKLAKGELPL